MEVERWSEVLALVAGVLGLIVIVIAWPGRQPDRSQARVRHPTISPPIRVRLDTIGEQARWRVANRHGVLDVSVDIVTFRPSDSDLAWASEPIVEPVRLSPGRSTTLPTVVEDSTLTYDVVVAWTVQHLDGGVQSTRTFTVGPDSDESVEPVPVALPGTGRSLAVVYGLVAVLLAGLTSVATWRLLDAGDAPIAIESTRPISPIATTTTTTTTSSPATSTTEAPATTLASSTATSTSTAPPSVATTTTAGPATTTTSTIPATTVPGETRQVAASGRVDDCSFSTDCLIASFRLEGFPGEGEYVCEFDDGSRVTFRYIGDGADDACARSGSSPSITIEVDGVRSATITRDSLDGT